MYLISKLEVEFKITYPIIKENKNKEKIFIKRQKKIDQKAQNKLERENIKFDNKMKAACIIKLKRKND